MRPQDKHKVESEGVQGGGKTSDVVRSREEGTQAEERYAARHNRGENAEMVTRDIFQAASEE